MTVLVGVLLFIFLQHLLIYENFNLYHGILSKKRSLCEIIITIVAVLRLILQLTPSMCYLNVLFCFDFFFHSISLIYHYFHFFVRYGLEHRIRYQMSYIQEVKRFLFQETFNQHFYNILKLS